MDSSRWLMALAVLPRSRPCTSEAILWMACSNCFMPSCSLVSNEIARGRISSGSCSCSTPKRRVLHRSHEHPLALGQVVADDVGDGVRLARARRPLHDDAIGDIQELHDAELLVVERLGKVEVARLLAARARPANGMRRRHHGKMAVRRPGWTCLGRSRPQPLRAGRTRLLRLASSAFPGPAGTGCWCADAQRAPTCR